MQGETFEQGKRSVTIEDIELFGQGEKLVVNTKLSGSYNGNIYMVGKPEYNQKKNSIDIKNLKFTLETRNFLLKSAGWLLRSTVKKKIQENMDFLLEYNMAEIEKQMQEQLKNLPYLGRHFLKRGTGGTQYRECLPYPGGYSGRCRFKRKTRPFGEWLELIFNVLPCCCASLCSLPMWLR